MDDLVGRWEYVERWHWRYWIGAKAFTVRFRPGKNFCKLNGWTLDGNGLGSGHNFPTRIAAASWIDCDIQRQIDAYHDMAS